MEYILAGIFFGFQPAVALWLWVINQQNWVYLRLTLWWRGLCDPEYLCYAGCMCDCILVLDLFKGRCESQAIQQLVNCGTCSQSVAYDSPAFQCGQPDADQLVGTFEHLVGTCKFAQLRPGLHFRWLRCTPCGPAALHSPDLSGVGSLPGCSPCALFVPVEEEFRQPNARLAERPACEDRKQPTYIRCSKSWHVHTTCWWFVETLLTIALTS